MKPFWGHLLTASIVGCAGGMILPACAHNDSSLFIQGVASPPVPDTTGACLYEPASSSVVQLFGGRFDAGLSRAYSPVVVVGNQLTPRGDPLNLRTETSRVQLRGAIVRVTDPLGKEYSSFTSLTNGFVDPAQGGTPSFGEAAITIIDPSTSKLIADDLDFPDGGPKAGLPDRAKRKQVITYFKVFGQTLGGTYVESGETQFVVEVCNGCLVSFPPDASTADATKNEPYNCKAPFPAGGMAASGTVAIPCQIGQETAVDCRLCAGDPVCSP